MDRERIIMGGETRKRLLYLCSGLSYDIDGYIYLKTSTAVCMYNSFHR